MKLSKDLLPDKVSIKGTYIPVIYKGELRRLVDLHYGNDSLVYLKNNKGKPVLINDLSIKKEWIPLISKYSLREKFRETDFQYGSSYNNLLVEIGKLERKFFE